MSAERFGGTWWGRRWVDDLERLSTAWQNRLPRGKDYAAKGHVISLQVSKGKITARVQGSRSKPYSTSIEVVANRDPDWERLIRRLASRSRYPAQLLAGEMPRDIEDAFRDAGLSLFPSRNSELMGRCSCPDKGRPCKHIAAVHYAFGEALDRDPFLLFQLRGADRSTLLREFQRVWFGDRGGAALTSHHEDEAEEGRGERVLPLSADRFNRSPALIENMAFEAAAPESPLLVLRRLDQPRPWTLPVDVKALLGPVYEEASALALRLALSTENGREEEDEEDIDSDAFAEAVERAAEEEDGDEDVDGEEREARFAGAAEDAFVSFAGNAPLREAPEPAPARPASRRAPAASSGEALQKMLGDALPSNATRRPASKRKETTRADAEPAVLIRRGQGEPLRRRQKKGGKGQRAMSRAVAIDASATQRDADAARALEQEATAAWNANDAASALETIRRAWELEASERRLLLLLAAADDRKQLASVLDEQGARIARHGDMLAGMIQPAELLLLCAAGRWKTAASTLRQRAEQRIAPDDGVLTHFLGCALLALAGHARVAPGSALAAQWQPLFDDQLIDGANFDEALAPAGVWLEWSLEERPPSEEDMELLEEALCELALALLADRSARTGAEGARRICQVGVAVAEALTLRESHQRFSVFLHRGNTATADHGPLQGVMSECLVASPILPSTLAASVGEVG